MDALRISFLLVLACIAAAAQGADRDNPQIDYEGYARSVEQVRQLRPSRRVSEDEFLRLAALPGTVILDARSERLYRLRHIAGAVNLSFPEFTQDTLAALIPSRETRVLIYCNNNFEGAPASMPAKAISSALNVSTFVSLYSYGYRNVYELGPAIDVARSRLEFAGREVR